MTGLDPLYLQEDEEGELIWQDRADASKELTAILNKMVRYHFQDRYQSATQVLEHRFSIQNPVQIWDYGSSQKPRFRWLNIQKSSFWYY